jgi:hypothetical protein
MLLVVTLFACWLGYELNWMRQRHALLAQPNVIAYATHPMPVAPRWDQQLLGEPGVAYISIYYLASSSRRLSEPEQGYRDHASRLFPEAQVRAYAGDHNGLFSIRALEEANVGAGAPTAPH